jgi:parallel beta-helix repeat protein
MAKKPTKGDLKKLNKELETVPKVAASEVLKDPDHVGHMTKQGGSFKSWKKRLCVLHRGNLYYYKGKDSKEPKGCISVVGLTCERADNIREYALKIIAPHRTYYTACETETEAKIWLEKINVSAALNAASMIRVVDNSEEGDAQFKTLREAVEATMSSSANNIIMLRAGTYIQDGCIEVKKGVEIKGVYSDSSYVRLRSTDSTKPVLLMNSRSESKLTNLTLEYDPSAQSGNEQACIVVEGKCKLENIEIANTKCSGVLVDREGDIVIEACTFTTNHIHGVSLRGNSHAKINRTKFRGNGGHGIFCTENSSVEVTGSIFAENGENGIRIQSSTTCNVIKNKFLKNKRDHISVDSKAQAVLTANEML